MIENSEMKMAVIRKINVNTQENMTQPWNGQSLIPVIPSVGDLTDLL